MDFELNDDERALIDTVAGFCAGRFPMQTVRSLASDGGVRRDLWQELGRTGVFSLRAQESAGGAGLGVTESVLVFEELGRALVPGPLAATHIVASHPEIFGGDIAARAAAGECAAGLLEAGRSPVLIEFFDALDTLVVLGADGVDVVDPAGLDTRRLDDPFDPLTPVWWVDRPPSGPRVGGKEVAARLGTEAAALSAAMSVGIARRCVELAVDYARAREQFDRPIGSFQAVKHILADALTRAEVARAALHAAGVSLDDPTVGDPARAVAAAKLIADETAVANARAATQVYGGMGFTWEVDVHLYLKRALVLATSLGTGEENALFLAGTVEPLAGSAP